MPKTVQKDDGKCRSSIYALSIFTHYSDYVHIIPNASPGLRLGELIFGRMFELAYRKAYIRGGAYIQDFTVYTRLF